MAERHSMTPAPQWTGTFENYARAWTQRNFWRVYPYVPTYADAVQECAVIFADCVDRYWNKRYEGNGKIVDDEAWFMALYKATLDMRWIGFARRNAHRLRGSEQLAQLPVPEHDDFADTLSLGFKLADEVSSELKCVMRLIADAPGEVLELLFAPPQRPMKNRRLCRFARIHRTEGADVLGELRRVLTAPK